jgi:hypothetical protein
MARRTRPSSLTEFLTTGATRVDLDYGDHYVPKHGRDAEYKGQTRLPRAEAEKLMAETTAEWEKSRGPEPYQP